MFENIMKFFKKVTKKENEISSSKDTAKERLHLVLVQDRANVSADFLELMKQEIIEVIKKYIEVDEEEIDVHLTNKENTDGTKGSPALYANIPIVNVKDETRKLSKTNTEEKVIQPEESDVDVETKKEKSKDKVVKKEEKIEEKIEEKKEEVVTSDETENKDKKNDTIKKTPNQKNKNGKPKENNKQQKPKENVTKKEKEIVKE